MREHRGNGCIRWLSAVALVVALGSESSFGIASHAFTIGRDAWMPDVGPRIAELTSRAKEAAAEAKSRRMAGKNDRQWWRAVAARPGTGAGR